MNAKKTLFVQFILENIWTIYQTAIERKDKEKLQKIADSLGLKLAPRDLRSTDARYILVMKSLSLAVKGKSRLTYSFYCKIPSCFLLYFFFMFNPRIKITGHTTLHPLLAFKFSA